MAVLLCRNDGKPFPSPPLPELRGLPRLVLDYQPLPGPDHQGRLITTRAESSYASSDGTPRKKVWKKTYKRRRWQKSQCGFYTPVSKPYKDMGTVELDDRKLILEGLGQVEKVVAGSGSVFQSSSKSDEKLGFMMSPYGIKLHAKTASQYPTELLDLDQKIFQGDAELEVIRKGKVLSELIEKERITKQLKEEERAEALRAVANQWRRAEVATDFTPNEQLQEKGQKSVMDTSQGFGDLKNEMEKSGNREDRVKKEEAEASLTIIDEWHMKLCVLVWILETMQMEFPEYGQHFRKCWDLDHPVMDEEEGQRKYEQDQKGLLDWDDMLKPVKLARNLSSMRKKFHSYLAFRGYSSMSFGTSVTKSSKFSRDPSTGALTCTESLHSRKYREDMEKLRKQKKLTQAQMEKLQTMLDEELSYSQKQSRSRMNAIKESGRSKLNPEDVIKKKKSKWSVLPAPVTLDVDAIKMQFSDTQEEKSMIVHEQLASMEKDREVSLQQRLKGLHVSRSLEEGLKTMREGVSRETPQMAKQKILMNYDWFQELESMVPSEVKSDQYCQNLMDLLCKIAKYMCSVGPKKMSKKKLIQVLSTLSPWELQVPCVAAAIEFIIQRVVYITEEDYAKWLERHKLAPKVKRQVAWTPKEDSDLAKKGSSATTKVAKGKRPDHSTSGHHPIQQKSRTKIYT